MALVLNDLLNVFRNRKGFETKTIDSASVFLNDIRDTRAKLASEEIPGGVLLKKSVLKNFANFTEKHLS